MNTQKAIFVGAVLVVAIVLLVWWYFGFSLQFMQFFAAESTPVPSVSPGATVSCTPIQQAVGLGDSAALTAVGGSGEYVWYAPEGIPSTGIGKQFSVVYSAAGEKKVTIESARGDGSGNVDSVFCTIVVQ